MSARRVAARSALLGLAALTVATVAMAAGGEDGSGDGHAAPGILSLFPYIVNFALFLGLLAWRVKRPASDYLAERRTVAIAELEKAQAARKEAEAALAAYKAKLAELEGETDALVAEARQMAETERERILANARATAERIEREAGFTVEQEIKRARLELEREIARVVAAQAADAVRDAMSDEDQARLVDEFVAKEVAS